MVSFFRVRDLRRVIAFALLWLVSAGLHAACTTPAELILQVGNQKADKACRFATIQAAINAATCSGSTILISSSLTYAKQALTINNKSLLLYGAKTCSDVPTSAPGPQVAIDGANNGTHSVIAITGNGALAMQNLMIRGGALPATNKGGGIYFDGVGSLTLANVSVYGNTAGYGAGLYVHGDKGSITLDTGDNVLVEKNKAAHDGGGVYLESGAYANIRGNNTSIYGNIAAGQDASAGKTGADGYGGGVFAGYGAGLSLSAGGVPGLGGGAGLGAIDGNQAVSGGGVAILGLTQCEGTIRASTADSTRPVQISANRASSLGGAIYIRGYEYGTSGGFCPTQTSHLDDTRLAGNSAADGAAIYLDWDTADLVLDAGSHLAMNVDASGGDAALAKGAVSCRAHAVCAAIEGNLAQDSSGKPTKGSTVFVGISSNFVANRVHVLGNSGDNFVYIRGDNDGSQTNRFTNLLVEGNVYARSVITQENDNTEVIVDSSTIAGNKIEGDEVFAGNDRFTLTNSLLGDDPKAMAFSGNTLTVNNVIAANAGGLPLSATVLQGDPGFMDAANADFTLADASMALDFAPATPGLALDYAGLVRNVDLPGIGIGSNIRDLGAYERNTNVALPAAGGVASASSVGASWSAAAIINGDHTGAGWPSPQAGWRDDTLHAFPDYAQVSFPVAHTITRVVLTTLQDDYLNPVEPGDTLTFSQFGLSAFSVQVQDPVTSNWITVANVTGNNLVKRSIDLAPMQATAVRINGLDTPDHLYSRIVELEVFGG